MKEKIHPKWYPEARVHCACGNTFTTGSTIPEIAVEICSACHPLFTGQQKFVDTAGRVDKFQQRMAKTQAARRAFPFSARATTLVPIASGDEGTAVEGVSALMFRSTLPQDLFFSIQEVLAVKCCYPVPCVFVLEC